MSGLLQTRMMDSKNPQTASTLVCSRFKPNVFIGFGLIVLGAVAGILLSRQFPQLSAGSNATQTAAEPPKLESQQQIVTLAPERQAALGIETTTIKAKPFVSRIWRTGRIVLNNDRIAHICPLAEGIIREVRVALGQRVAEGDILAVIESRDLGQAKLDVYKAQMALATEREIVARTRMTTANAEELLRLLMAETPLPEIEKQMANKPIGEWRQQLLSAYTRRKQLRAQLASQKASGGAIPEATILKTQAEADAAEASYIALHEELKFQTKNLVRQAELKLKDAETTLDVAKAKLLMLGLTLKEVEALDPIAEGAAVSHMIVKAPFAGTIIEKHAVRSERVSPQSQIFVLADLETVWVQADLFEADLPLVRGLKNSQVVFRSRLAGVEERSATVVNTGDLIDPESRTLTLTAEASNRDRMLKPGMYIEVGFDNDDQMPTIVLPGTAIMQHGNNTFVFVKTGDNEFQPRSITLGRRGGEEVEVTAGLREHERVVIRNGFVLKSVLLKDEMVGE